MNPPTDEDLSQIQVTTEPYTFDDVVAQADQLASELADLGEGVDPGKPSAHRGGPKLEKNPLMGKQPIKKKGQRTWRGKGKKHAPAQMSPPKESGKPEMMARFLAASNTPEDTDVGVPIRDEVPTSAELETFTSVSEALSDNVIQLTNQLHSALTRIDTLEKSNSALQVSLAKIAKEVSVMRLSGLRPQSSQSTSVGPPRDKPHTLSQQPKHQGHKAVVVAPKPTMLAPTSTGKEGLPEWGISDDIE